MNDRMPGARGASGAVRVVQIAAWLAGMSALAAPTRRATAQALDSEFSVQRFDPAPGPRNYLATRGARTDGKMVYSAGLIANYAYRPFVRLSCATRTDCADPNAADTTTVPVVESLLTGTVIGSLTPIPRVQIGLEIPVSWVKGEGIAADGGPVLPDGISAVGLGDVELEGKARLWGNVTDPFVVGGSIYATGPFGHLTAKGDYLGDSTPSVGMRAIFDGSQGPVSFGGNIGGILRGSGRVGTTTMGPEMRYNIAGGYQSGPIVRVILEGFGSTRFTADRGENALEALLGMQVTPPSSKLVVTAGVGTGIVEGVGVPAIRGVLGLAYVAENRDRDNDGIDDDHDQCPTEAEDKDGYEDSDGCPDLDNDLDGIPDSADKCPNQAEDRDGFEDADGCPDPDNDKDGIPDTADQCPDKPETKNGFKDEDGCPDVVDTDGDGVPDDVDKCPNDPEDTDGFEDTDGCPDPDNDKDGIPDIKDECIDEPETINGYQDSDGCPDEVPGTKPKAKGKGQ